MPITLPSDLATRPDLYHVIFDDFNLQASATASEVNTWTSLDDGATGTNAFQDTVGGWYNLVTAAANNDYHGIRTVSKTHNLLVSKRFWLDVRFKIAEATTNESAWWFGVTDTTTTGGFSTGTGGILSSFDGALIYKKSGAMAVSASTSKTTTQSTIASFATAVTNTVSRAQLYFDGGNPGYVTAHFYDGTNWNSTSPILMPQASAIGYLLGSVKAGATAAAETLQLDYVLAVQDR